MCLTFHVWSPEPTILSKHQASQIADPQEHRPNAVQGRIWISPQSCIQPIQNLCWQEHGIAKRKTSRTFAKATPKKVAGEQPEDGQGMIHLQQRWLYFLWTWCDNLAGLDVSSEESLEIIEEEEEESEFEDDKLVCSSKVHDLALSGEILRTFSGIYQNLWIEVDPRPHEPGPASNLQPCN